jgi:hypothetical protein
VYDECKKDGCCILGECVFGHKLVKDNYHPQAIIQIHYAKTDGGLANALRMLKNNKPFNGEWDAATEHLEKIFPNKVLP